ncbi:uncharacterized protein [Taeniopygia guttata]|uniref:uncharacterized protein n=1 Tax=Taeniopygia guttata TaxID=59729 RepID=UPI003BB8985A
MGRMLSSRDHRAVPRVPPVGAQSAAPAGGTAPGGDAAPAAEGPPPVSPLHPGTRASPAERHQPAVPAAACLLLLLLPGKSRSCLCPLQPPAPGGGGRARRRCPREAGKGRAGRAAAGAPLIECGSPGCGCRRSPQPLLPVRRWFSSSRAAGGRRAGGRRRRRGGRSGQIAGAAGGGRGRSRSSRPARLRPAVPGRGSALPAPQRDAMRRSRSPRDRARPALRSAAGGRAEITLPGDGRAAPPQPHRSPRAAHRRHGCGSRRCPRGARDVCARPPGSASRGTQGRTEGGRDGGMEGGARGPGPAAAAPRGWEGAGGARLRWAKLPSAGDLCGERRRWSRGGSMTGTLNFSIIITFLWLRGEEKGVSGHPSLQEHGRHL